MLDNPLLHLLDQARRERESAGRPPDPPPPVLVEAARLTTAGELLSPGLTDYTPLAEFRTTG